MTNGTVRDRIMQRIIVTEAGCWEWQGTKLPSGYGTISVDAKRVYVHRAMCEEAHGPIPQGLFALHSCDNPPCCNSEHLRIGTPKDNTRDAVERRRLWVVNVTHCRHGHEYTLENTKVDRAGKRRCRECARIRSRAEYADHPEYWRARNARSTD